jgi:hypothetical protein
VAVMPKRSLFAILCDLPWWVSLLVAGLVFALGAIFSPVIGAAAALPFFGVMGYVGWLRVRRGPALDIPALLKGLRAMSPEEMRAMLGEAFSADRYQLSDGANGDLRLERNGYVTLVRFRRWRAQSTSRAALDELHASMQKQKADHATYITAGTVTSNVRQRAQETGVTVIDGEALAELVKRTAGAKRALARANTQTEKA